MKYCLYCGLLLDNNRKKYCNELHKYRYISIKNDVPLKTKKAQNIRIERAGRKQRSGKVGCRYN